MPQEAIVAMLSAAAETLGLRLRQDAVPHDGYFWVYRRERLVGSVIRVEISEDRLRWDTQHFLPFGDGEIITSLQHRDPLAALHYLSAVTKGNEDERR